MFSRLAINESSQREVWDMEEVFGKLMLLACGIIVTCAGVFNWEWFMRSAPIYMFFPKIVARCFFAAFGTFASVLAVAILMGYDVRPDTKPIETSRQTSVKETSVKGRLK